MDGLTFICSVLTLTIVINEVCPGDGSCQVSETVSIRDSWTFSPQEGHLKHGMFP